MKKKEIIARYGEAEYARRLERNRERNKKYREEHREEAIAAAKKWREEHPEEVKATTKKWREEHPEEVKAHNHEHGRKDGKYYDWYLRYKKTGLQGARNAIRKKHRRHYKPYKDIIAPDSQIHHEWVPNTDEYRGIALVEAAPHMHGFVDVIEILNGKITLLTEEQIRKKQITRGEIRC